jgi:hypothetical protein
MDSQETKIRKGQAFNLSVHDAVANGQANNPKYIYQRFIYYYTLADAVQGSDLDLIQEVVANKNFDDIIKKLQETLK